MLTVGQSQDFDTVALKECMRKHLKELLKEGIYDLHDKELPSFQIYSVDEIRM